MTRTANEWQWQSERTNSEDERQGERETQQGSGCVKENQVQTAWGESGERMDEESQ